jgi:hypothetical protein
MYVMKDMNVLVISLMASDETSPMQQGLMLLTPPSSSHRRLRSALGPMTAVQLDEKLLR